jgi:hypothetical protein
MALELPDLPESRIAAIRLSLRCLVWGLLSLIPLLGLVFGLLAVADSRSARAVRSGLWNPGCTLVRAGLVLASLGFLGSAFAATFVLIGILESL